MEGLDEQMNRWRLELLKQQRLIDREVSNVELAEAKLRREIKAAARRNSNDVAILRTLGKELVVMRKTRERIYNSRAKMNSVAMSLRSHMATIKVANAVAKSAEIMAHMNQLVKLHQFSAAMQAMAREMVKAGVIDEMINDTISSTEPEGVDEAAEEEVNKALSEILATMPVAGKERLPAAEDELLMARVAKLSAT